MLLEIRTKISNYKIIINHNDEIVVGYNRNAPSPWVVWKVDRDGGVYWGRYYGKSNAAEARRCFINEVMNSRSTPNDIENIIDIQAEMLEGKISLSYDPNTNTYDVLSKSSYDFDNIPQRAWNIYIRELQYLTLKQFFEILNLEKV